MPRSFVVASGDSPLSQTSDHHWEIGITVQTRWGGWCCVIVEPLSGSITCLWHLKGCSYQLCSAVDIPLAQDACQLRPPGGCCNLLHSPHNSVVVIGKGGLRWALPHSRVIRWFHSTQEFLHFGVQYGWVPKAPSSGCDQSAVSGAADGGMESSTSMACDQSAV